MHVYVLYLYICMYVCINGYFVICDWEFGLRLIGFQAIWCILFGLFVSLSFWVLRKKLHFFHLQEKKLDFCYFFSLSPCWTMDHSCRTWWDFSSSSLCIWLVIESMTSDRIIWWKRIHVTDPDQFVEIFSRPQAFGTEAWLFLYMWLWALVSGYCVSAVVLFCCFVWIWAFRMRIMWSLLCDFDPFWDKA